MSVPSNSDSTPDRARRLLAFYMDQRGSTLQAVATALGTAPEQVAARLRGSDAVSLAWVEEVLKVLEVPPGEFFSRLYSGETLEAPGSKGPGQEGAAAASPDSAEATEEILHRDEVEGLVREARSLIRGAARMVEARAQADDARTDEEPSA